MQVQHIKAATVLENAEALVLSEVFRAITETKLITGIFHITGSLEN